MIRSHKPNARQIATLTSEVLATITEADLGIKDYKRYPGGDEAEIFAAELTFRGVAVASLYEAGRGGELEIHWYKREFEAPVKRIVDALPEEVSEMQGKEFRYRMNIGTYLGSMADDVGEKAEIIKMCKTKVVFRRPGDGASFVTYKGIYTAKDRAELIAKYGPEVEILNETVAKQEPDADAEKREAVRKEEDTRKRIIKMCAKGVWYRTAAGEWRGWKLQRYTKAVQANIDAKSPGALVANRDWLGQTAV